MISGLWQQLLNAIRRLRAWDAEALWKHRLPPPQPPDVVTKDDLAGVLQELRKIRQNNAEILQMLDNKGVPK